MTEGITLTTSRMELRQGSLAALENAPPTMQGVVSYGVV